MLTPKFNHGSLGVIGWASALVLICLTAGGVFLLAGCHGGQNTGTVEGVVRSGEDGHLIQNATVEIGGQRGTTSAEPGLEGSYSIPNVPLGQQEITVLAPTVAPDGPGLFEDYPGTGQAPIFVDVQTGVNTVGDILLVSTGGGPGPPP